MAAFSQSIKSFADKQTQQLYLTGSARRVPPDVAKRAARKLEQVNAAILSLIHI